MPCSSCWCPFLHTIDASITALAGLHELTLASLPRLQWLPASTPVAHQLSAVVLCACPQLRDVPPSWRALPGFRRIDYDNDSDIDARLSEAKTSSDDEWPYAYEDEDDGSSLSLGQATSSGVDADISSDSDDERPRRSFRLGPPTASLDLS